MAADQGASPTESAADQAGKCDARPAYESTGTEQGTEHEDSQEAFTQVRHLSRWWGPEGFTTATRSFEFRAGGEWDFVMHGPDGTDYQEWITKELRDEVVQKYHAIEGGEQALSNLAAYVADTHPNETTPKGAES